MKICKNQAPGGKPIGRPCFWVANTTHVDTNGQGSQVQLLFSGVVDLRFLEATPVSEQPFSRYLHLITRALHWERGRPARRERAART